MEIAVGLPASGGYQRYHTNQEKMCIRDRMIMEQKIVNAMVESLEKEEFMVCLQPKVEIDTGKILSLIHIFPLCNDGSGISSGIHGR